MVRLVTLIRLVRFTSKFGDVPTCNVIGQKSGYYCPFGDIPTSHKNSEIFRHVML